MAQNDRVVVGIDIAKEKVDSCIRALASRQTFPNTVQGHRRLIAWLRKHQVNKSSRKKILIIDNDSTVRQALVQMVQALGHQPIALDRAMGAARVLLGGTVDAMLLDLNMPGPHGQDLLRYLRKRNISIPPTIIVSGYLQREAIGDLIRLGVAGIIAKPFDPRRLQDELGHVLEGREGRFFFCPHCGMAAQQVDRFCRQCGTSLESQRACPQCQAMHGPADRFCGECGAKLGKAAEEPAS